MYIPYIYGSLNLPGVVPKQTNVPGSALSGQASRVLPPHHMPSLSVLGMRKGGQMGGVDENLVRSSREQARVLEHGADPPSSQHHVVLSHHGEEGGGRTPWHY